MRSKTYMSKINLKHGKLTAENRKSREKKTDMLRSISKQSGESVQSVQVSLQRMYCNVIVHTGVREVEFSSCVVNKPLYAVVTTGWAKETGPQTHDRNSVKS